MHKRRIAGSRTALRRFFARHNISFKKESLRAAGHRDRELIRCEASRMVKNSSEALPFTPLRGGNNARAHPVARGIAQAARDECPCPEGTAGDCPAPDRSLRCASSAWDPANRNSRKRAPGPITARGDTLRCSRIPGTLRRAASHQERPTSVPATRPQSSTVSCAAGRARPGGELSGRAIPEVARHGR
jgi:hypothetical protein